MVFHLPGTLSLRKRENSWLGMWFYSAHWYLESECALLSASPQNGYQSQNRKKRHLEVKRGEENGIY